ncbi:MAG: Na+/H+ antiporter NhaA [Phycisphaerales bacterium]|nr:Na+/H+ antiporter NhaA [Phycisphaerales bacterium]
MAASPDPQTGSTGAPSSPIQVLLAPVAAFMRLQAAGGVVLLVCTVAALVWANSPWQHAYHNLLHLRTDIHFGSWGIELSLEHLINDGLMAIFFFVVGLEIKRELVAGHLSSLRKALMPLLAAAGGMAVPALIFTATASSLGARDALHGWAIPSATDIAFAVGVMSVLGSRVPISLKVFLTALAIFDDLGAVVVIAFFYTSEVRFFPLEITLGLLVLSAIMNRAGVRSAIPYALVGAAMWVLLLRSGVHATVGGVLLAMTIPASVRVGVGPFLARARAAVDDFRLAGGDQNDTLTNQARENAVERLRQACDDAQAPLARIIHTLHPWVAFLILPLFALANAGVTVTGSFTDAFTGGVGSAVSLGLLLGKPVGIVLTAYAAARLRLAELPEGVTRTQMLGAGCLAGIGFTMSLFIANLSFPAAHPEMLPAAKIGILTGSAISAVLGFLILRSAGPPARADNAP